MTATIREFTVEANGARFHVGATGDEAAPPILCLHGFPEGWISWRPVMTLLADDYRIYVPELRSYPANGRWPRGYDVFTLTDDVAALIDALGLDRPMLLSHDWGGALGWIFGHRFGERISHLIVVNCTHPRTLVRAVYNVDDWQTFRRPRDALLAAYRQPIRVPTTLVWGLKDGALSAKVARRSSADAGCEVAWRPLEGVGHFVNLEAPELLAREVRRAAGDSSRRAT